MSITAEHPATDRPADRPVNRNAHRAGTLRLGALAVAFPLWGTVSLVQAATRPGYDLLRHPLSALALGDLGWIQSANFVVAGVLAVVGATGLSAALRGAAGGVWAPRLVAVAGAGMFAAGLLRMDPFDGFPLGAPAGMSPLTWHGIGHMVAGTIAFAATIAACFVLGRYFARGGRRDLAVVSRVAGVALLLGDGWATAGAPHGSLTLAVGGLVAMVWVSVVAARLRRER